VRMLIRAVDRDSLCRALVESMSDAVLVLDPGAMRFILANEAASRLFGYGVDQLCTMQPTQLSNAWDAARVPEIVRSVAETGSWRGRWLIVHKQGQPCHRRFSRHSPGARRAGIPPCR